MQASRAENHHNGLGIGNGVDFEATLREIRKMRKLKTPSLLLPALETALFGACWSDSRVNDAKPECSAVCRRCNLEIATDTHNYWYCNANLEIQNILYRN